MIKIQAEITGKIQPWVRNAELLTAMLYLAHMVYGYPDVFLGVVCSVTRHTSLSATYVGGTYPCAGHEIPEDKNCLILTPLYP